MSRDGRVAVPRRAMGLSVVCHCGISYHTHLLFLIIPTLKKIERHIIFVFRPFALRQIALTCLSLQHILKCAC